MAFLKPDVLAETAVNALVMACQSGILKSEFARMRRAADKIFGRRLIPAERPGRRQVTHVRLSAIRLGPRKDV